MLTFCWTQSDNLQSLFFFSPYKLFSPFSCHQIGKILKISVLKTSCVNLNNFSFFSIFFSNFDITKLKKTENLSDNPQFTVLFQTKFVIF